MEEMKFISELLCTETVSSLSLFSSHPLFSCAVSFYTLLLLYFPHLFQKIILSPVLILTGILLFIILRLGAVQISQTEETETKNLGISEPTIKEVNRGSEKGKEKNSIEPEETNSFEQVHQWVTKMEPDSEISFPSNSRFEESFTQWNVKAPLEVIYEEYEGEEEEEESEEDPNEKVDTRFAGIRRYPSSLSRYFPESESESDPDSSSYGGFPPKGDWDSLENICFRWDEEEREGLIEIALEEEGSEKKRGLEFHHFEEENLIEIDISPTRYGDFSGDNELFSGEISCSS